VGEHVDPSEGACLNTPAAALAAEAIGSERSLCAELLNWLKSHDREDAKVPGAEAT
jgi:hypothetical protein